jgi:hypothetical protein
MKHLEKLSSEELHHLLDAIPLITILVAGADGVIDNDEKAWAARLTHIRTYSNPDELHEYYESIDSNFNIRFNDLLKNLPTGLAERESIISNRLSLINPILAKLDQYFGFKLYKSFLTFATQVAKSSGGFLGFNAISEEEEKWVHLSMIHPIIEPVAE